MNLLKLFFTLLSSSVILNAGTVTWSSGVNVPLDKFTLIVLFTAILFIGLWFSKKAPTSVKMSLVALVLVSGVYKYNLNAAMDTINITTLSGSSSFLDFVGFTIVNNSGATLKVTITPGPGWFCPVGGCNYSLASGENTGMLVLQSP